MRWWFAIAVFALLAGCDKNPLPVESGQEKAIASGQISDASEDIQSKRPPELVLDCANPVKPHDTGKSILDRFGDQSENTLLLGAEGTEIPGIVLWPLDRERALELGFDGPDLEKIVFARPRLGSQWAVAGLKLDDPLDLAIEANGRDFGFFGFEWDYGGNVFDWKGGKLGETGECRISMRLGIAEDLGTLPLELVGDREVSSANPRLRDLRLRIEELAIGY